jgi:hypothetical protein
MQTYELFSELTDKNSVGYLTETEWKEMVTESLDEKIIEKIYIKSLDKIYDNIKSHWSNNTSYEETVPITELRNKLNAHEKFERAIEIEKKDPYKAIIQIEKDEMASRYNEYIQFANKGNLKHKKALIERLRQRLETLEANHNTQQIKDDLLKNIVDTKIKINYIEKKEIDLLKYFLNEIKDKSETEAPKAEAEAKETLKPEIIFTLSSLKTPEELKDSQPNFMTYFVLFLLALLVGWCFPFNVLINGMMVFLCFHAMDLCMENKFFSQTA